MAELKIPCGCQSRKEIMSNGDWQIDAGIAVAALVVVSVCLLIKTGVKE